ncbi:hypothetical protein FGIG_03971 [Fasciola gigantica]|uniref:Uncharacterized protein n=1 Tax=Fasciola gigantica TaxID=46835 RepID=A0A504YNS5_FASGI|nr:hypothetical protein FGIG_03971 [Fasciola gigantica]
MPCQQTVQTGYHLYITDDILQPQNRRGFKCSTCNLSSGRVYGYPGWTYRQYFKYGHFGGFRWASGSAANFLLVLATDQSQMERINIDVYEDSANSLSGAQKSIIYQPFQTKLPSGPRVPKVSVILIDRHRSEMFNLSWDMLVQVIRPFVPLNSLREKNRYGAIDLFWLLT